MNKINYQKLLDVTIEKEVQQNRTPTLLLHSCCAPCSSYVIEYLSQYFSITVFYYNPNIAPAEEYQYRVSEQKRLISLDTDNLKTEIRIDEEGSEIERNELYNDGSASFFLNEEGKLIWDDEKEDAGAGFFFEKIGWFQGVWIAGENIDSRYELYCYWDTEEPTEGEVYSGYKVEIERYEDETYTHWTYTCIYDAESNTLQSILGHKEFEEREGEPIVTVYDDGKAEFSFDDDGFICWKDEIENAGEGLQFNATNG